MTLFAPSRNITNVWRPVQKLNLPLKPDTIFLCRQKMLAVVLKKQQGCACSSQHKNPF